MRGQVLSALLVGALLQVHSARGQEGAPASSLCTWTHPGSGAKFDLSQLNVPQLSSVGYRVQDGRGNSNSANCA